MTAGKNLVISTRQTSVPKTDAAYAAALRPVRFTHAHPYACLILTWSDWRYPSCAAPSSSSGPPLSRPSLLDLRLHIYDPPHRQQKSIKKKSTAYRASCESWNGMQEIWIWGKEIKMHLDSLARNCSHTTLLLYAWVCACFVDTSCEQSCSPLERLIQPSRDTCKDRSHSLSSFAASVPRSAQEPTVRRMQETRAAVHKKV